ncbi:hypothetical protein [Brooklawnia sp.]
MPDERLRRLNIVDDLVMRAVGTRASDFLADLRTEMGGLARTCG